MAYKAQILADSINERGDRLTTFEITFPRFVLAELNTHRVLSKNTASSRAIPVRKMIDSVLKDPVEMVWWGRNQSGMQARESLVGARRWLARQVWLKARYGAVAIAWLLLKIGLHKQIVNRLLEPWLWVTVIVSGTNFEHMFSLRCHPDAQPEFQRIAFMMRELYDASIPVFRRNGEWHLPYITDEERRIWNIGTQVQVCVARCARVSYVAHGTKKDLDDDIELYGKLSSSGHWSPLEHAAQSQGISSWHGNFRGWKQMRKFYANEFVTERAA